MSRRCAQVSFYYDLYDSERPSVFLRLSSTRPPYPILRHRPSQPRGATTDDAVSIALICQLGQGATGIVHGGELRVSDTDGEEQRLDVAVKLAFTGDQKKMLREEYKTITQLRSQGVTGITTILGYYEDVGADGPAMLLMLNAGVPLYDVPRVTQADR